MLAEVVLPEHPRSVRVFTREGASDHPDVCYRIPALVHAGARWAALVLHSSKAVLHIFNLTNTFDAFQPR